MTTEQAEKIIATMTKQHARFHLLGFQVQPPQLFVTFEPVDVDSRTVGLWFEKAGGNATRIGREGNGDNEIMYAVIQS